MFQSYKLHYLQAKYIYLLREIGNAVKDFINQNTN